jgi:hypothetical protein
VFVTVVVVVMVVITMVSVGIHDRHGGVKVIVMLVSS